MFLIRNMVEEDQAGVERLAIENQMFAEGEWTRPQLANLEPDHHWIVGFQDDKLVGAAYLAPEPVSAQLWNIFFLAVAKDFHGQGIGKRIMQSIEELALIEGIATLIVETSSLEGYARARAFYSSIGYVKEAEIRNYYGAGDNKVTYWKFLIWQGK